MCSKGNRCQKTRITSKCHDANVEKNNPYPNLPILPKSIHIQPNPPKSQNISPAASAARRILWASFCASALARSAPAATERLRAACESASRDLGAGWRAPARAPKFGEKGPSSRRLLLPFAEAPQKKEKDNMSSSDGFPLKPTGEIIKKKVLSNRTFMTFLLS